MNKMKFNASTTIIVEILHKEDHSQSNLVTPNQGDMIHLHVWQMWTIISKSIRI